MDWNFELTEQAALALYAKKYRQEKASGRLLRALGAIIAASRILCRSSRGMGTPGT